VSNVGCIEVEARSGTGGEPGRFDCVIPYTANSSSSTGIVSFFGMVEMVNGPASRGSNFLLFSSPENLLVSKANATLRGAVKGSESTVWCSDDPILNNQWRLHTTEAGGKLNLDTH